MPLESLAESAPPLPATKEPLQRKVPSIRWRDAYRLLWSATTPKELSPEIQSELPAIITHWLHDVKRPPMLVGPDLADLWRQQLARYQRVSHAEFVRLLPKTQRVTRDFRIDFSGLPISPAAKPRFKFADVFAGIGGFRIALEAIGGKATFSCEWDRHAKETYLNNYGEVPFGDVRQFTAEHLSRDEIKELIPDHDVLAAGFPCQPFSRAGVSARRSLGQEHGFACEVQGTLFFDLVRIVDAKRPKVLLLENVGHLERHDGGRTLKRIQTTIEEELGYSFKYKVIDSSSLVPQRRKRCYMVCFKNRKTNFDFPTITGDPRPLREALEKEPDPKYTISNRLWEGHIARTKRNLARGVGFTAFEANIEKPANTLVARYYKDGKECLVPQFGQNPRKLTPRECARLQGYPEDFLPHIWDVQAYRQFGNSVTVPVVRQIADRIGQLI